MTEEEAKTKWCFAARTAGTTSDYADPHAKPTVVGASVNREPGDYDKHGNETVIISGRHRCIGSACMAWRWESEEDWAERIADFAADLQEGGNPAKSPKRAGHCGLAGKP